MSSTIDNYRMYGVITMHNDTIIIYFSNLCIFALVSFNGYYEQMSKIQKERKYRYEYKYP